jgi:hypothetical protein
MDLPLVSDTIVSKRLSHNIIVFSVRMSMLRRCGPQYFGGDGFGHAEGGPRGSGNAPAVRPFRNVRRIKPPLPPNEVNTDKQQGCPEQPGVVRETQCTDVIDDQQADQLPGDDGRKEERRELRQRRMSRPPRIGLPVPCTMAWPRRDRKIIGIKDQSGAPPFRCWRISSRRMGILSMTEKRTSELTGLDHCKVERPSLPTSTTWKSPSLVPNMR